MSRRRHTSFSRDWSSDVCSSDLADARQSLSISGGAGQWLVRFDGDSNEHTIQSDWLTDEPVWRGLIDGRRVVMGVDISREPYQISRSEERRVGREGGGRGG